MLKRTYRTFKFIYNNWYSLISCSACVICQRESYGHQIHTFDHASRLFSNKSITIIWYNVGRGSSMLPNSYGNILPIHINWKPGRWERFLIKLYLFFRGIYIIDEDLLFKINSKSFMQPMAINPKGIINYTHDYTGWFFLTRVTKCPITKAFISKCYDPRIGNQKLVVLSLRGKINGTNDLSKHRCCSDQNKYISSIKWLIQKGFCVAGTCETDNDLFENKVLGFSSMREAREKYGDEFINFWLQTNCDFYLSQHSGAAYLPASIGAEVILLESLPHCQGLPGERHTVLWQDIKDGPKGKLRFLKILNENHNVFYGDYKDYIVSGNTERDILRTVSEHFVTHLDARTMKLRAEIRDRWLNEEFCKLPRNCALACSDVVPPTWWISEEFGLLKERYK